MANFALTDVTNYLTQYGCTNYSMDVAKCPSITCNSTTFTPIKLSVNQTYSLPANGRCVYQALNNSYINASDLIGVATSDVAIPTVYTTLSPATTTYPQFPAQVKNQSYFMAANLANTPLNFTILFYT